MAVQALVGGVDGGHQQVDLVLLVRSSRSSSPAGSGLRRAAQRVASALAASTRPTSTSTVQLVRVSGPPGVGASLRGGSCRGRGGVGASGGVSPDTT